MEFAEFSSGCISGIGLLDWALHRRRCKRTGFIERFLGRLLLIK
jgi:hypothetical protein